MTGTRLARVDVSQLPFQIGALERWLLANVAGFERLVAVWRFEGGQSNPTFLLEAPDRRYVLRSKPAPQAELLASAHAVDREFRVQSALHGGPVPVARMYGLCEDESVAGRCFYVMDYVEGRIFWQPSLPGLASDERRAIYHELTRVIAELHELDVASVGLSDYSKPTNYLARQIARWTKQYAASQTQRIEEMDRLIEWLPANMPEDEGRPPRLVHGDYRLDNVIFHPSEPRILAVIDWELSSLGDPLVDLAYYLMSWRFPPGMLRGLGGLDLPSLGIPDEAECLARYEARTARRVTQHWNFYLTYNFFRLAAILQGIAKRVELGTASSSEAIAYGRQARPLAQLGWQSCQQPSAQQPSA